MDQSLSFLSSLYGEFNDNNFLYLWTLPGRKTYPFNARDLHQMATQASQLPNHDVYFGVGATNRPLGPHERAKNTDIISIPGIWVDIDIYHPKAHKTKDLPPDMSAALSLIPGNIPPSLVVWSGYGIHVYWLFREPWELESPEEHSQATELLQSIQAVIKHNAGLKNWKVDTTADLSRVLRLPGTMNRKLPDNPVPCQIAEQSGIRYNPGDIIDLLPPVPESTNQSVRTEGFERRPTDGPAELMLRNCRFLQHCHLNAVTIGYDEWLAALTNIVRASDGIQAAHEISSLDTKRYNEDDTNKKINEALSAMNPQTCDYIRNIIGFHGCPGGGCGVQAPCGWSLSRVARARATVRSISKPAPETVFEPDVLGALAVLKKDDAPEYAKFKASCRGQVNLNDLEKLVSQHQPAAKPAHLHVVQPGEKPGQRMLRFMVPDLPIDLALPPNFSFENSGVSLIKENPNATNGYTRYRATGCPVVVSERVYNIDTQMEKLEICFRYLNGWRRVLLPRSTVMNARKIICLADYGVSISSETTKYAVKWLDSLIHNNQDNIPVTKSVSKLGWRTNKEFVLPGFNNDYRIDIDDDGSQQSVAGFTASGDRDEWVSRMQYLRQSPKARFIFSASFAAPLLKLLGHRNFIIHNWGTSQDGKTATLWAAMSVWGDPDKLIGTFDTTATAIERKAAIHSDLPLAINEREVLNRYKKQDINPLLYVLGEGRGRGRGTKTGLQALNTWRTIVMSTGEGTLSTTGSLEGVMTRVLEVCDGPLAHNREFARGLYYFLPKSHGHAGPEFLGHLLESDHGMILTTYHEFRSIFQAQYPDRIDSHVDAVACVATADYLASAWIFGESWETARAGAIGTGQHILSGLITKTEASESERAWGAFIDWIAENEERFSATTPGPKYGVIEGMDIYVIRKIVNDFLDNNFSSSKKIIGDWGDTGKIEAFIEGGKVRYDTKGKRLKGGIVPRMIKLTQRET